MSEEEPKQVKQRVGDLNGPFMLLFKLNLVLIPCLVGAMLAWGGWVTGETIRNKEFRERGDRYTDAEAARDRESLKDWVHDLLRTES